MTEQARKSERDNFEGILWEKLNKEDWDWEEEKSKEI